MAFTDVIRRVAAPLPATLLSVLLLGAAFLLTFAAQPKGVFGNYYTVLLVVNVIGIVLLSGLILVNLWRLVRQFRQRILGSRLTLRFLATFVLLALLPLSVVYYFSVQFLSKGIDSWFDVRIEQALDDALLLGRTTLETIKQDLTDRVNRNALAVADANSELEVIRLVDELRTQGNYQEISIYSLNGRIIASSNADAGRLLPEAPDDATWNTLRQGKTHTSLEPMSDGALRLRVAMPVYSPEVSAAPRIIHVLQALPLRYSRLGDSVQVASAEYDKLQYLRGPLKFSFVLTLTLITLMTTLMALWVAFFSARRLVAPLKDLAEGTRAVAQGDYGTQLPVTSGDELGVLVQSFNDMTKQIQHSQSQAQASQRQVESQRTYLQTILAHLSSGVMSIDTTGELRTFNKRAEQILGVSLDPFSNQPTIQITNEHRWTQPLIDTLTSAMNQSQTDTQKELSLYTEQGRKSLLCQITSLPDDEANQGGYVMVFDDVTALIQAQRDAAWGEVARRLAHEIKNPLTPIQLSAERIRHKYLDKLEASERPNLDRATRTIVQQVESMKRMVNDFSNYAQPVGMQLQQVNINRLIRDAVELHQRDDKSLTFELNLMTGLPQIEADSLRLTQVFNNLFINARDAMADQREAVLRITTRETVYNDQNGVEIVLKDNGPGFPSELVERAFEPYVTSKSKGTGLGLAIVKRIVDEHAGRLRAGNSDEGGAAISLSFPISIQRHAHVEAERAWIDTGMTWSAGEN